jgi:hypothetical protein
MAVQAGYSPPPCKQAAFKEAGWRVTRAKRWTVCWGHIFTAAELSKVHQFQRVNHFPGESFRGEVHWVKITQTQP